MHPMFPMYGGPAPYPPGYHFTYQHPLPPRNVGPYQRPADLHSQTSHSSASSSAPPRRRRVSAILEERLAQEPAEPVRGLSHAPARKEQRKALAKEPRRRTIYIPDDTTVFTIHPGTNFAGHEQPKRDRTERREPSPDFGLDLVTLSEHESKSPLVSAMRQKSKSTSRKSFAAPPKRAPLKEATLTRQNVAFADDLPGALTGKENCPPVPHDKPVSTLHKKPRRQSMLGSVSLQRLHTDKTSIGATMKTKSTTVAPEEPLTRPTRKRLGSETVLLNSQRSPRLRKTIDSMTIKSAHERTASVDSSLNARPTVPPLFPRSQTNTLMGKSQISDSSARSINTQYPVLQDDLGNSELFEEQWLDRQEIALTQLLNTVLQGQQSKTSPSHEELRPRMLLLYQNGTFPALHKKLRASINFGALNIHKSVIDNSIRLKDDLGLRDTFVALFVETYNLEALRTAVEVIVGREIVTTAFKPSAGTQSSILTEKKIRSQRKAVARYLNTFFLHHEDAVRINTGVGSIASIARSAENGEDEFGSLMWSWRRTVLRSLMLVLLLDQTKTEGLVSDCLFQSAGLYKSSAAVLQALGSVLLPSIGDISRPLAHMGYTLTTVQQPLQEYDFRITNLAADLRDGIKLCRLVETVVLGHADSPYEGQCLRQVKYPCLGRPLKVSNVQIALSELSTSGDTGRRLAAAVTAEDVVDGHREKTLSLLWGLVSQVGIQSLVDWDEVRREIRHIRAAFSNKPSPDLETADHERLLLLWAQAVAAQRKLRVTNLTTSFSDPRVVETIVDAYHQYLPQSSAAATEASSDPASVREQSPSLAKKLQDIGCSTAFTSLFLPDSVSPIPSAQFILTTLTYFASRLLPLARAHRSACIVQRAWRRVLARREITKRLVLRRLATHCATVVRTRETVVGAATIIQRAWRRVLERRIQALLRDVVGFQAVARGFLSRTQGTRKRRAQMRIRGGW